MTQKERLANLLDEFWKEHYDCCNTDAMTDHLLSNGVIVPPCKVGDTVYSVQYSCFNAEGRCDGDCPACKHKKYKVFEGQIQSNIQAVNVMDIWGTVYFLTREEAEQALKERNKIPI